MRNRTDDRPTGLRAAWSAATAAWFTPAAVLVGLFDVAMAVGVLADEDSTMPGRVVGPAIMLCLGLGLFAGLWLRWASRYGVPEGPALASAAVVRLTIALALIATFAVGAVVFGFGGSSVFLLVAGGLVALLAAAAGSRKPSRTPKSVLVADVLIVLGLLPAIALFWMVIPPILALVVIGGLVGTGPRFRHPADA